MISNVLDFTEDQSQRINALMEKIKEEENELTDEHTNVPQRMVVTIIFSNFLYY